MSLRKPPVTERCDFPVWFKGPRHWHVLMGNAVYNYHTKWVLWQKIKCEKIVLICFSYSFLSPAMVPYTLSSPTVTWKLGHCVNKSINKRQRKWCRWCITRQAGELKRFSEILFCISKQINDLFAVNLVSCAWCFIAVTPTWLKYKPASLPRDWKMPALLIISISTKLPTSLCWVTESMIGCSEIYFPNGKIVVSFISLKSGSSNLPHGRFVYAQGCHRSPVFNHQTQT